MRTAVYPESSSSGTWSRGNGSPACMCAGRDPVNMQFSCHWMHFKTGNVVHHALQPQQRPSLRRMVHSKNRFDDV
eukprot:6116358-Pyramimonas_sp.AAC.1